MNHIFLLLRLDSVMEEYNLAKHIRGFIMFSFFRSVDQQAPTPNRMSRPSYYFTKSMMFLLGATYVTMTKAEKCFESLGGDFWTNDVSLDCMPSNQEDKVFDAIKNAGLVYNTGSIDCANYFTDSKGFCKGFFGGNVCTITYHQDAQINPQIFNITAHACKDAYGTGTDIVVTSLIGVGGLIVVSGGACLIGLFAKALCQNSSDPERQPINRAPNVRAQKDVSDLEPSSQIDGPGSTFGI